MLRDGLHQVGFAQPDAAVDEQGLYASAGRLRHGQARGVGKAVAGADDEAVKRIARIEDDLARLLHSMIAAL